MSDFFLTLLTRPGCHLCDQAQPMVSALAERYGTTLRVVDIDNDDDLIRGYSLRIPVVLDQDGVVLGEGQLDARHLRRQIRRARQRTRW